jgi:hypothetical protein
MTGSWSRITGLRAWAYRCSQWEIIPIGEEIEVEFKPDDPFENS